MSKKKKNDSAVPTETFTVVDKRLAPAEEAAPPVEEPEDIIVPVPARPLRFNPYPNGVASVAAANAMRPTNGRILARAIMPMDYSSIGGDEMNNIVTTRGAMCFEVMALADDIPKSFPIEVGCHFKDCSASADSVNPTDPTNRWWMIWWGDVQGVWWPAFEAADGTPEWRLPPEPKAEAVNVQAGMYPLSARHVEGRTWEIVDNAGETIMSGLTERAALVFADNINARAARHDPGAPFAFSAPVESLPAEQLAVPQPQGQPLPRAAEVVAGGGALAVPVRPLPLPVEPLPPPTVTAAELYQGLDEQQMRVVHMTGGASGVEAALSMANGFRQTNAIAASQRQGLEALQAPPNGVPPPPLS